MTDGNMPDWVAAGVSFRDETGPKEFHTVYHVRAVVDGNQVVMRFWESSRRTWRYVVECDVWFAVRSANLVVTQKAPGTG